MAVNAFRRVQVVKAFGIAAVIIALALVAQRADAAIPMPDPPDELNPDDWLYPIPDIEIIDEPAPDTEMLASKIDAFLYAVRRSEHLASDVASNEDFRTFYGGSRFTSFADHPVLTGEKVGVPLPPEYCRAAGFEPPCVSTAAGALQINVPTWKRIRLRGEYLADFTPASQLEAGRRLLRERGADRMIAVGDVENAVYRMAPIWASLPRSTSTQPHRSIDDVMAYYSEGLTLA